MTHPFSPAGRQNALTRLGQEEFDLLIVGGGITGCGLAREAALQGLQVALVEKVDFGYGTSSRSSKLIHGGFRYLAEGDFRMVWESVRERRVLRRIAPQLVHPLPFVYPFHRGEFTLAVGPAFRLLERMTGAPANERFRSLSAADVLDRAPAARPDVTGGIGYLDFVTDDGRLTLENALDTALRGAVVVNHARVKGFLRRDGRVIGARVVDELAQEGGSDVGEGEIQVRSRAVVNATGPWAEETLRLDGQEPGGRLLPSKGIHLLFRAERLPVQGALVLRTPSGRQGFAISRGEYVYVGTTDEFHQGPLDQPVADAAAVRDLLALANEYFPTLGLTAADVVATWAGLRPLIHQEGRDPRHTSRHDQIWVGADGLITVAGGKLTTYRLTGRRIMRYVARALGRPLDPAAAKASETMLLPGAPAEPMPDFERAMRAALGEHGVLPRTAARVIWLYGGRVRDLLALGAADPAWLQPLAPDVPALRGEVALAVQAEMAGTLLDFLDRRSALLIFSDDHGQAAAEAASRIMAGLLGWSEARRQAEVESCRVAARSLEPEATGIPAPEADR